jgi:predicted transposase YbfD/YdcC
MARLKRRVRRKGKKTTEIIYLISSFTLEQLDALGFLKYKRGYWVIESRLHHVLDITLGEDQSRVRTPNAALVLGMFRRVAVSFAWEWVAQRRREQPKSKASARTFQKSFGRREGGAERLWALLFAKNPVSWRLAK